MIEKTWPRGIKNPGVIKSYKSVFDYCELTYYLTGRIVKHSLELHHILGGAYRSDEWSLIIRITNRWHRLFTDNVISPVVLFGIKCLKQEVPTEHIVYYAQHIYRRASKIQGGERSDLLRIYEEEKANG